MTSRERLWAAMRRQEVDKVPCSPRLGQALPILYGDHETDPEKWHRLVPGIDWEAVWRERDSCKERMIEASGPDAS